MSKIQESIVMQPDFYASLGTLGVLGVIQSSPEYFLPQSLLGRRFNGIVAHRFYCVPLSMIASSYIFVADRIANDKLLGGHMAGLGLSVGTFAAFSCMHRLSPYLPSIGVSYAIFGIVHHYRSLKTYFDGSPLVSWRDLKEIGWDIVSGESKKLAKEQRAVEETQRQALIQMYGSRNK